MDTGYNVISSYCTSTLTTLKYFCINYKDLKGFLGPAVGQEILNLFCLRLCLIYGKEGCCVSETVDISVHQSLWT